MTVLRVVLALLALSGPWVSAQGRSAAATPTPAPSWTVRVAAAADLKFALDEIAVRLAAERPGIRIDATYGSSGSMHAQLTQRAPYDVYLSADVEYPGDLVRRGIGSERDLFNYAVGRVVLWVPLRSPLAIEREGLGALRAARRVAIANPRHAPYGRAAEAALRQAGVWSEVSGRLVLGENVAQAAQFVQSGAADAGIIARSLAVAPAMRGAGRYSEIPESAHPPLTQAGLILPWAVSRVAAERLRDYLTGEPGRALLAASGFTVPSK